MLHRFLILGLAGALWGVQSYAQLPKRDLTVEIRQVEEGREDGATRFGTKAEVPLMAPQKILVRNGEKGSLRMGQSVPMQWVQSANMQNSSINVTGDTGSAQTGTTAGTGGNASISNNGGGVTQALQWFEVGQSITVTPRWPGGNKDATVEVDVQQADMAVRHNADMPRQTRNQLTSMVTTPLGQWVTIAATGNAPARQGSYSSEGSAEARRLLQVRVLAP